MKDYVSAVLDHANELVVQNISPEELDEVPVPVQFKDWWFTRFYTMNLDFAYDIAIRAQKVDTVP